MSNNSTLPTKNTSQRRSARIKFFPASIRKTNEEGQDNLQHRVRPVKLFSVIDALEKEATRAVPAYFVKQVDEITRKMPAYRGATEQNVSRQGEEERQTLTHVVAKLQHEQDVQDFPLSEGQVQEQLAEDK